MPGILRYFDIGDLACLIAPRPLVIVARTDDFQFPVDSAVKEFEIVKQIYERAGAADKCRLVIGDDGHRFYPDAAWSALNELVRWI